MSRRRDVVGSAKQEPTEASHRRVGGPWFWEVEAEGSARAECAVDAAHDIGLWGSWGWFGCHLVRRVPPIQFAQVSFLAAVCVSSSGRVVGVVILALGPSRGGRTLGSAAPAHIGTDAGFTETRPEGFREPLSEQP